MKKKNVAAFFAFPFGVLGLHRFYLGQRLFGIIYLASFIWGIYLANIWWIEFPFVMIPILVSFIDAMLFWAMPKEDFDAKYNSQFSPAERRLFSKKPRFSRRKKAPTYSHNAFKKEGIERFKDFDFEGAIEEFKKSLGIKYDDPSTHFNLACSYSYLEDAEPAFFHLSKSVEFGFVDFERIYKHDALAWLRLQPEFEDFVKNGYQLTPSLPEPQVDLLESIANAEPELAEQNEDLLDQIIRLGDLRDKGILTEEEFILQKKKLLEG